MEQACLTKINIGISSCLLGEQVRYDGGHKRNRYITDVLAQYFDFKAFCPEMAIGLGTPRETIHLVNINDEIRCRGTKNKAFDVTEQLYDIADQQQHWHNELCGYILKKDSPSCGMERVKLYRDVAPEKNTPTRSASGLYAKRLMDNFPCLPIEEEGRLGDAKLRENFIQRVYIYARWRELLSNKLTLAKLQSFHAQHKYIFMSHDQMGAKKLGAYLTGEHQSSIESLANEYLAEMMALLKKIATKKNHVNTLQHIQGYLKRDISADDKQELKETIEQYHQGFLPLIVPITLLRHHFRHHENSYINDSFYMQPHPSELMLLNSL